MKLSPSYLQAVREDINKRPVTSIYFCISGELEMQTPDRAVHDPKRNFDDDRSRAQIYAYMSMYGPQLQSTERLSLDRKSHRCPDPIQMEAVTVRPKNRPWYQKFDKR